MKRKPSIASWRKPRRRFFSLRNVFGVIRSDAHRIFRNVIVLVILFGLCVVPCLYAWFNIFSNWDPYGIDATSRIRVAVTSEDKGASLLGLELNLGEQVVEALEANDSIGWVFVDSEEDALELVRSSNCYAALIIPPDFSENVAGIAALDFEHPSLLYYENDKKNAIAPKITGKAKTAVQEQVNATFIKTIMKDVATVLSILDANGLDFSDTVANMAADLQELCSTIEETAQLLDSLGRLACSSGNTLDATADFLDNFTATLDSIGTMNGAIGDAAANVAGDLISTAEDIFNSQSWSGDIDAAIEELQAAVDEFLNTYASNLTGPLLEAANRLSDGLAEARAAIDHAHDVLYGLSPKLRTGAVTLLGAQTDLYASAKSLRETITKLEKAAETLNALADSEYLEELTEALTSNSGNLTTYFASPIKMKTVVLYPVENYGSVMAPFYTVLAQWVGALFCAALLKARVRKQDFPAPLSLPEEFVGRYVLFFCICMIQALVTALGDLYYVGIYCLHPGQFILGCCVTGLCFSLINYSLLFSLEKIGLGTSVILMVIQVAGSGGSYPVDVLPPIFRILYPFMPFNYAMNALREAVAGTYGDYYLHDIRMLGLMALAFFILGQILYYPVHWLNKRIAESALKSEVLL